MCSLLALNPATNLSPQRKRTLAREGSIFDHYPSD
jgi:hypothetical protein